MKSNSYLNSSEKKQFFKNFDLDCFFSVSVLTVLVVMLMSLPRMTIGQDMKVAERDESGLATKFDFDLASGDLQGLIRFIGEETDYTIIASEEDIREKKFALTNLKSVTLEETLEKVKTVLAQYNLTMIKTDSTLLITTFEKAVQMKVPVKRIAPDPTLVSDSDEIQTYVIELTTAQATQLEKMVKPLINKPANVFADDFSNSLVITDVSSNVRRIVAILQSVDDSEVDPILIEIVPLVNAEAAGLADVFNNMFRRDRERARRVWDKLDKEDVTRAGGAATANMIGGPVEVTADESSNSLILKGTARNIESVKRLVAQLDTAPNVQSEVRIFRLNYAIAEDIAETLGEILEGATSSGSSRSRNSRDWWRRSSRNRDRGRRGQDGAGRQGVVGEIGIAFDERLNAIVVSSDPRNFSFLEKIINELDEADTQDELEIYYLKFADAQQLSEDLTDLFEGGGAGGNDDWRPWWDRGRDRGRDQNEGSGGGFGVQGNVHIVPELRLNALLVSTSQQNFATIDKLIKDLDVSMPDQEWGTRIYRLQYAAAENLQAMISGIYSGNSGGGGGGRFWFLQQQGSQNQGSLAGNVVAEAYPTLNSIIISTSTARNFELIEKFIKEIDVPTPEGQREVTRLYKLEYTDANEMENLLERVWDEGSGGSSNERGWQQIERQRMGMNEAQIDVTSLNGKVEVEADIQTNSLVVQTLERYLPDVEAMIRQLDFIRGQVLIQIEILEITLDEDTKLGLELTASEKGIFGQELTGNNPLIGSLNTQLGLASEISGFNYALATNEYLALLHTLMRENRVKTLSRPSLLTRDNQEISWSSGKSIPYLQSVNATNLGGGGDASGFNAGIQPLYNYGFIDPPVGININLIPHIARTLATKDSKRTIGLEIDDITASNFIEFTEFNAPITETNTISAYVDVEDGAKVVVGGMMRETQQEVESKVPFLGDIPFIGRLFRKTQKIVENSEIVIIITPHIIDVRDPEDIERLKEATDQWRQNGASTDDNSIKKSHNQDSVESEK